MIPIYYANVTNDLEGIIAISLVDCPAVESDFVAFDKNQEMTMFRFEDEAQRKVLGVIMRCEYPIYRRNEKLGEFYLKYSRDVIERMARKMLRENTGNMINLMHDDEAFVDGVVLEQVFIKDTGKGVSPSGFEDISDGSMFGVFKIENDAVWEEIRKGTFRGFSLEGYFSIEDNIKEDKENMNLKERLRQLLAEFAQVETDKGILVAVDEVAVGAEVTDENGNPIADGEYKSEDRIYVIKDGKVEAINEAEPEEPQEPSEEPKGDEPNNDPEEPEKPSDESEKGENEPEPEPQPEPIIEEPDYKAEIDALKAAIEAMNAEINGIREMLKQPASTPIEEEFEQVVEPRKAGNSKLIEALEAIKNKK